RALIANGCMVICEGANMPTTADAARLILDSDILYGPAKAANAGGVAVSGLEMTQNSLRMSWSRAEVDSHLHRIMKNIHQSCLDAAANNGLAGNYVAGANIAGFTKVADAMLAQGVV
ncbi:MAG: glutamate dehydrogenase, partial [Bacteroidota bacterium]|nr:glutamate dehydrogenase [Bacteroidota bacterium]